MKQVRLGTFETKSSIAHSLVMCTENEYKDFQDGKLYYVEWMTKSAKSKLPEEYRDADFIPVYIVEKLGLKDDMDAYTYEEFFRDYLESFEQTYTTPSGEKVVAFGQFGYDD